MYFYFGDPGPAHQLQCWQESRGASYLWELRDWRNSNCGGIPLEKGDKDKDLGGWTGRFLLVCPSSGLPAFLVSGSRFSSWAAIRNATGGLGHGLTRPRLLAWNWLDRTGGAKTDETAGMEHRDLTYLWRHLSESPTDFALPILCVLAVRITLLFAYSRGLSIILSMHRSSSLVFSMPLLPCLDHHLESAERLAP